jgi:hypothetical protein
MKVYVYLLVLYFVTVHSMKMMRPSSFEETLDDGDLGDFQKLLSKFNWLSQETSCKYFITCLANLKKMKKIEINKMPRIRFAQVEQKQVSDDPEGSAGGDIKFPDDDTGFSTVSQIIINIQLSGGTKDQELKRIEGLSNGLILYNSKRTVNSETSDFSHLYFDLLEN